MRTPNFVGIVLLATLSGCGLESMFRGASHTPYPRPATALEGAAGWAGAAPYQFAVLDGNGDAYAKDAGPFELTVGGGHYAIKLPSSSYSMSRVQARAGHMVLRALVPWAGPESVNSGIDLDARNVTENLIVEASLSQHGLNLSKVNHAAYDDPATGNGTRKQIRAAFDAAPATATTNQLDTQALLKMVERILPKGDPLSADPSPGYFTVPVLDAGWNVTQSPLSNTWLRNQNTFGNPIDYTGDGIPDLDSTAFDAQLALAARHYQPWGCPDPSKIRLVFTVDFNAGCISGSCGPLNRFLWTTNLPGKKMFFVGWLHKDSDIQDPSINALLGGSVPNTLAMYDDGTNGDEVASDGVYTIVFDVPRDPAGVKKLRIGYKYTWGFQGQPWSGSEEWPGNSRIIQVDDMNGDGFVYRRDVYQDEASNKDQANLNPRGSGTITWSTDLRGCGIPEAREQKFVNVTPGNMCTCVGSYHTPSNMTPIYSACQ